MPHAVANFPPAAANFPRRDGSFPCRTGDLLFGEASMPKRAPTMPRRAGNFPFEIPKLPLPRATRRRLADRGRVLPGQVAHATSACKPSRARMTRSGG